ncbi:MAG TPA: VOC family protein, partial [Acidimicrobiales bacterium]|nr:VOC family protein [Acidimicrobiales bacterium]
PNWVNHVAFGATSREDLDARRTRWQENGLTVLEINHEWCRSIYATDPNGMTVEFCCTTRAFTPEEIGWADDNVLAAAPELDTTEPETLVHRPLTRA